MGGDKLEGKLGAGRRCLQGIVCYAGAAAMLNIIGVRYKKDKRVETTKIEDQSVTLTTGFPR